jgi:hypothetical protein
MVSFLTNTLLPFLDKPKEQLHLAAISRVLEQPHPTVRLWLQSFVEKRVLKKSHKGRQTLFQLNFDHPNIVDYLTIAEKQQLISICEKELILRELTHFLVTSTPNDTKILFFGSVVTSFTTAHDIDILVVGPIDEQSVNVFCTRFKKPTHIIHTNSFDDITPSLREEITKKHLIVKGSEDILRWLYGLSRMVQKTTKRNKTHRT